MLSSLVYCMKIKWKNIPSPYLALSVLVTIFKLCTSWRIGLVAFTQPVPLFGQHASFADALASDSARECDLVTLTLSDLDASLCAIESHRTACEFLQIVAKTRRASLRNYKSVIEKMLLWCLVIRHKSLLDVDNSDLIEFFLFLEVPPDNWVAKPTRRFIHSRQDIVVNKLWRPFRYVKNNTKWCRPLVGHFLATMKSRLQEGLVVPKKLHLQKKIMPPNMAALESEAVEYLKKISSYTSLRGRHEKKLFVFVCAYYFRVSLPEFAKLAPYIYMDDFSLLSNGQWAVSVNSPERCIIENFPSEFTVYFNRYLSHLGIASDPVSNEHVALFSHKGWDGQPDVNTIYDWGVTLPRICTLGISAPTLLRWLSSASENIQKQEELIESHKNKTHKDKLYFERAYRNIKKFGSLQRYLELEKENAHRGCSPVPIFKFPLLADKIRWCVDFDSIYNLLRRCVDSDTYDEYVIAISDFLNFSCAMESRDPHLRSIAYEKFLLWSLLIKKIPPNQMTESDAVEFFNFCASPPGYWISNKRARKFVKTVEPSVLDANPEWRPFFVDPGSDKDLSFVRAARIISWCNSTQDWLISNDLVEKNIFKSLAVQLWRNG